LEPPQISKSGELLAKGRHIMMGYLRNAAKTREVLDEEGWLRGAIHQ
jgi:long-subunit acyl-CoA synthetase (AMP-forming)